MPSDKTMKKHIAAAERLAAENGGKLPTNMQLLAGGHAGLLATIQKDRGPFEHLLAKDARGRDKEKLAVVEANLDMDDDELARLAGISPSTLKRWRQMILDERGGEPKAKTPATLDELAGFVEEHLPEGWRIEVGMSEHGTFSSLMNPKGAIPNVREAEDKSIEEAIMIQLNFARKRAGLDPVEWEGE